MKRRSHALLALAVLVVAALAVGVADPLADRPSRAPVALDAPPAETAQSALRQAETGDYTLHVAARDANGSERTTAVARVENSEREVLVRSVDGPTHLTYANAHVGWEGRPGALERGAGEWDDQHTPFHRLSALDGASGVTRTVNGDAVRIRVADDETALTLAGYRSDVGGNATLTVVVNRSTRTLTRTVFTRVRHDGAETERRTTVLRFSRWGETTVSRPPGAGYSLTEALRDAAT